MLIDVGLDPLCTTLPFRTKDRYLTMTAGILLRPHLHRRFPGVSVPAGGIRPGGAAEPSHPQRLWSTRSRHTGPGMPSHRICGQLPPSPLSGPGGVLHLRGVRQWTDRLGLERMDWQHGQCR